MRTIEGLLVYAGMLLIAFGFWTFIYRLIEYIIRKV